MKQNCHNFNKSEHLIIVLSASIMHISENKIKILIQSEYYKGGLQCRMNSKATNEMCWRRFKYVVDGTGQPGSLT